MTASSKSAIGDRAMLLAAGLGVRMRPLTDERPKPLIEVAGMALIDHALQRLRNAQVTSVVVNVHYKADMLKAHLASVLKPEIIISDEQAELLETGGGIAKALAHLSDAPFFVVNTDSLWIESTPPALQRLKSAWNDESMDMLLLLSPTDNSLGYRGNGDFFCADDGNISRKVEGQGAPFVFTGVYLVHPRIFKDAPGGKFSMNLLFDKAIAAGRLKGLLHDGIWMEINTPEAIKIAESAGIIHKIKNQDSVSSNAVSPSR